MRNSAAPKILLPAATPRSVIGRMSRSMTSRRRDATVVFPHRCSVAHARPAVPVCKPQRFSNGARVRVSRGRDRAAARAVDSQDGVLGPTRRAVEHRRGGRTRAGGVRRAGLLPELVQTQPANRDQRRLSAAHHRRRTLLGARARDGVLLHHRGLAVVHPRADPPPALLLLAALPAVRARARLAGRSASRYGGRPGTAGDVHRCRRRQPRDLRRTAGQAGGQVRRSARTPRSAANRPVRPPVRSCRTPPRPASS